jgi:TRAP-type mannitol/chloroaromatic compound transport system permease small subunit
MGFQGLLLIKKVCPPHSGYAPGAEDLVSGQPGGKRKGLSMQLKRFLKSIDRVSEWSGKIFVWLIIPLTLVVAYEVISRRVFNAPHIWSTEVTSFLYGAHFMLVAAYTLLYKSHVSIDLVYQRFRPRVRGILDIITHIVFFFPFCIIMLYQGTIFAYTSWQMGETSDSAALPIVPEMKTVIPVTFALLLLQGVAQLIRSIVLAVRGEEI